MDDLSNPSISATATRPRALNKGRRENLEVWGVEVEMEQENRGNENNVPR